MNTKYLQSPLSSLFSSRSFGAISICVFLLSLGLSSCTTDIEPNVDMDEVLVINMLAEAGQPITASVTHSWPFDAKPKDVAVSDAKVVLTLNGSSSTRMTFDPESKKFVSEVVPQEGDEVEVSVVSANYGNASGRSVVPKSVKIEDLTYTYFVEKDELCTTILPDGNGGHIIYHPDVYRFDFSLKFSDPSDEENYYLLDGASESFDPILNENSTALDAVFTRNNEFIVFSDRTFQGDGYDLKFRISVWEYTPTGVSTIRLYSISKEYYQYLISLHKKYDGVNGTLEEIGVAEPLRIYSNVSSGAGIVGAQSVDMRVIDFSSIVGEKSH